MENMIYYWTLLLLLPSEYIIHCNCKTATGCFNLTVNMLDGNYMHEKVPETVPLTLNCDDNSYAQVNEVIYEIPQYTDVYCLTTNCSTDICSCCVVKPSSVCMYKQDNIYLKPINDKCKIDSGNCVYSFKKEIMDIEKCPDNNYPCEGMPQACYSRWILVTYHCVPKSGHTSGTTLPTVKPTTESTVLTTEAKDVQPPGAGTESKSSKAYMTVVWIMIPLLVIMVVIIIVLYFVIRKNYIKQNGKGEGDNMSVYDEINEDAVGIATVPEKSQIPLNYGEEKAIDMDTQIKQARYNKDNGKPISNDYNSRKNIFIDSNIVAADKGLTETDKSEQDVSQSENTSQNILVTQNEQNTDKNDVTVKFTGIMDDGNKEKSTSDDAAYEPLLEVKKEKTGAEYEDLL